MKRISAICGAVLLAGFFSSCSDISGLENRIESAESRIYALEKNVGIINSNVEAIRQLVEGGTVSSVVEKDGTYTITFSDGKVITLNQGSIGVANAPIVSVDADGFWTVDYGDGPEPVLVSGQKVKAAGSDGVTPKFGVDDSGYWTVSYDNGQNYVQVLDAAGKPVKAVADGGSSAGDSFFRSVSVKGDRLEVVLKDGMTYSLLIVKDFSCVIKGAEDVVTFACGETKTFTVETVGVASVMVTAPQGWSASFASSILSVTAPETVTIASETVTRALSADSKADVCLLAVSETGISSISKVKVYVSSSIVVTYPGLYGKYLDGEDVTVGGVTVNKTAFPSVNYISASSADKTLKAGVNFVDSDAVAVFPTDEIGLPFIVAGNTEGARTEISATSQIKFASTATISENIIEFQNISLSNGGFLEGYLLANINDNVIERIGFSDCLIEKIVGDKNLSYMSAARNVNSFAMKDCDVWVNSTTATVAYLLQMSANTYTMQELTFDNNVFWSDGTVKGFCLYSNRKGTVSSVKITHNTFVNVYPQASYAYCQINDLGGGAISNNLFYFEDYTTNCNDTYTGIVKEEDKNCVEATYNTFVQNYAIYKSGVPTKKMKVGQNTNFGQIYNKKLEDAAEIFDFGEDSENFNISKGIFKPKNATYGASR